MHVHVNRCRRGCWLIAPRLSFEAQRQKVSDERGSDARARWAIHLLRQHCESACRYPIPLKKDMMWSVPRQPVFETLQSSGVRRAASLLAIAAALVAAASCASDNGLDPDTRVEVASISIDT